jgi:type IV secretion system protein VirB10
MISGIYSDLPGHPIAKIAQNVYDTATGRDLLLPRGFKLFGVYDSRVVYGQSRVLIAWNRLIFLDGSSVTLGAMPGSDIQVTPSSLTKRTITACRVFGSAALMPLVTVCMNYAADQVSNSNSSSDSFLKRD